MSHQPGNWTDRGAPVAHDDPAGLKTCAECGSPLSPRRGPGRPQVYCTATCRSRARRRLGRSTAGTAPTPFAATLATAVGTRGRPLHQLVADMAKEGVVISASTISNWQTGRNLPHATPHAVDVVYALERAVGTQSGDLVIVLRQTRELQRRGVAPHNHVSIPAGQQSRTLAARRARLERRIYGQRGGLVSRQSLVLIVERERYVVGADGRPRYSKIAYDVRALEEGIDSYWYVRSIAAGSDISIRDSRGCQPGLRLDDKRQYPDAREHLVAIELLLDEPLARGQAHQISYTVHHSYADPDIPGPETEFGHVVRSLATRELHLEIEFDLASVPSELTRCTWTGAPATLIPRLGEPAPDRRRDRQRIVNPASQGHGWIWT